MTKDEILSMPAGRELDALIAVSFFGWRWMKYQAPNVSVPRLLTGLFPPDAPYRWPGPNRCFDFWLPSDADALRFSNWDTTGWWDGDGEIYNRGFPYYSQEAQAALALLERLRPRYSISLVTHGFGWACCLEIGDDLPRYPIDRPHPGDAWAEAETLPLAVCRAALLTTLENDL